MKYPPIFGSKKATLAVISAFLTFLLSILPVLLPEVDPSIFQDAANFIMKIVMLYLPSQAAVDIAKVFKAANEQTPA
mgnify:CR=1 FL=1